MLSRWRGGASGAAEHEELVILVMVSVIMHKICADLTQPIGRKRWKLMMFLVLDGCSETMNTSRGMS